MNVSASKGLQKHGKSRKNTVGEMSFELWRRMLGEWCQIVPSPKGDDKQTSTVWHRMRSPLVSNSHHPKLQKLNTKKCQRWAMLEYSAQLKEKLIISRLTTVKPKVSCDASTKIVVRTEMSPSLWLAKLFNQKHIRPRKMWKGSSKLVRVLPTLLRSDGGQRRIAFVSLAECCTEVDEGSP